MLLLCCLRARQFDLNVCCVRCRYFRPDLVWLHAVSENLKAMTLVIDWAIPGWTLINWRQLEILNEYGNLICWDERGKCIADMARCPLGLGILRGCLLDYWCAFRSPFRTAPRGFRPLCDWHGWPDLAQGIGIERCSLEACSTGFCRQASQFVTLSER